MYRQHRLPIRGGRIFKPPCASERYLRVDFDLRDGFGSDGAQSHYEIPYKARASVPASAASSGNCRNTGPVSLPDIDEVADVRCLDQQLYDTYSTRILIQNELHRSRHFSARCHRIIRGGAKRTVSFGNMTSNIDELCRQVDASRLECALNYIYIL